MAVNAAARAGSPLRRDLAERRRGDGLRGGLEPLLELGHDLGRRRELLDRPLADPHEALPRVEEAVLLVAVDRGREERVRDAEARLVAARAAHAEVLGEALDAGLPPALVAFLAVPPRLRARRDRLSAGEPVGEGVADGARLHPL